MAVNLYVYPPSPRSFKAIAVAGYLGSEVAINIVDLTTGQHRTDDFAAVNPNRRVPALEHDGFTLWEANAILLYLANMDTKNSLMPSSAAGRARVAQWQFWDLAHWEAACTPLIFEKFVKPVLMQGVSDESEIARGLAAFRVHAPILDAQLARTRFACGDDLTIADFSLGAVLNLSAVAGIPVSDYSNIARWHRDLVSIPAWRNSMVCPPCNAA